MFALDPVADWFGPPRNGIYVINADGTGLALVTSGSAFEMMVDWSS